MTQPRLISIDNLHPGEVVLSQETVEKRVAELKSGGVFDPIILIEVAGRWIVRDGNNRARAFIEYHHRQGADIPDLAYTTLSPRPEEPLLIKRLLPIADYHGRGAKAFLQMKVCSAALYDTERASVDEAIRARPKDSA